MLTPQQFRQLAVAELEAVYRLAYHLCPDPALADDLVQETYLRAFRFADGFEPRGAGMRAWLFKILHNVLRSRALRESRQPDALDDLGHLSPTRDAGLNAPVYELAELNWDAMDQRLKRAIHELPRNYRIIFLLNAVEDLKYREIADVLELPIGTVMSRLYRAREMLAERLQDLATEQRLGAAKPEKPEMKRTV